MEPSPYLVIIFSKTNSHRGRICYKKQLEKVEMLIKFRKLMHNQVIFEKCGQARALILIFEIKTTKMSTSINAKYVFTLI